MRGLPDTFRRADRRAAEEPALLARLADARTALERDVQLSDETRQAQRARLVAVATVRPPTAAPEPSTRPSPVARRTPRAALALAVVAGALGLGGVAAAASQSLPGDPFYDVKRVEESVQLALSFDDRSQAALHLEIATTRLQEVRGLVEGRAAWLDRSSSPADDEGPVVPGRLSRVTGTLVAMDASTRSGSSLLTGSYREGDSAVPLRTLERWAQGQTSQLSALLPRLDDSGRDQAARSLELLQAVDAKAAELMGTSAPAPGAPDPGAPDAPTSGPTAPATPSGSPQPGSPPSSSPLPSPRPPGG